MKLNACLAGACLLVAASAQAQQYSSVTPLTYSQPEFYVGLNYSHIKADVELDVLDDPLSNDWNTVGINLGVQPSPYLAFEARYGRGVGSDEHSVQGGEGTTKLKYYYGFYALPQIPIQDFMSVYGLLGWTKAKVEAESDDFPSVGWPRKVSDSEDDFSYGVGVRFRDKSHPGGVAFFAEYAQLIDRDEVDATGLMVGLSWHF
ncbi:opacity protein-like surface antigen [Oceanisphaera litoralis]|uniref:porin family protein n=1 Tax=Oceanisphaera litoralis TaxID=225144 RepID=UPI00195B0361|nr:porin family protein [Oceanisphaera litoralis]MBM7456119.1 opacity protein-like surface antigen [Oceanisphaera litoralis]